jgi:hypothetical protein
MESVLAKSFIDELRESRKQVDTRGKVSYFLTNKFLIPFLQSSHCFLHIFAEAIYLEFQEPSSLCTNLTLQNNLKALVDPGDHRLTKGENKSPTTITNTILYPNQVYSNWFFVDIFI